MNFHFRNVTGCLILLAVIIGQSISTGDLFANGDEEPRPNVIVILTDDQGWADIGYNNPKVYTPHLDELASNGTTFTNHYVMPQCTPTRVALMTGRYPSRFGGAAMAASNEPAFPHGTPTMANMFSSAGYETFLCGKWHLGSSAEHGPNHFGFDHSYGSLAGAVGMYDHRYRDGEFGETWHRDHKIIDGYENGTHATDLLACEAIKIINSEHERPFFLYIPFQSIHTPLDERGPFVDQPTKIDPENPKRWINEDKIQWFNDPAGKIQAETDPEKRLLLAAVYHLDDAIGKIVASLDESGQRDNTLILYSSDNGPQVNWPGAAYPDDLKLTDFNQPLPVRGRKTDVWEGGIHVPAFANWPQKIEAKKSAEVVHIIDWFPTLASLIESDDIESFEAVEFDGKDLSNMLFEDQPLADRDLYFTWSRKINRWALRRGDWKIVKYGEAQPTQPSDWELFNLADDPKEKANVADANVAIVEEMHERFLNHRSKDRIKKQKQKNPAKAK